jgi:hypothetical protein
MPYSFEIKSALASGFSQGLDPTMINIGAAIKYDLGDPSRLRPFGDQLADRSRSVPISAGAQFSAQTSIE